VQSIWAYYAETASVDVADRVLKRLNAEFLRLSRIPGRGHRRPDLTSYPVLFVRVYQLLISYQPTPDGILIVAVLHGRRDIARVLNNRRL
jgi:plasmid stabilization system protein ParE